MKKEWIVFGVVAVVALLTAAFFLRPEEKQIALEGKPIEEDVLELFGLAESEEEAKQLAVDYEIEFINYADGVAIFQTDKSFEEIVKIGKDKGLSELSINTEQKAF